MINQYEKSRELLTKLTRLLEELESKKSDDVSYLQLDNANTHRTSIRVTDEQTAFGEKLKNKNLGHSRELAFSYCVEFARHHPDRFVKFAMNYIVAEVGEETGTPESERDEDSLTTPESEEDSLTSPGEAVGDISDESTEDLDDFTPDVPDPREF